MKKKIVYAIGLILMFSSSGMCLNARGMGGGGYGEDRGFNSDEHSGMKGEMGMHHTDEFGNHGMLRGDKNRFKSKDMKSKKRRKNIGKKRFQGVDVNRDMKIQAVDVIKKYDPKFAETLKELKTSAPRKYKHVLRSSSRILFKHIAGDSEKDGVETIKLEYETRELGFKYKKASSAKKKTFKKQLNTKLSRLFDLRAKGQEARLKNMEKNIEKLRAKLKDRKANKSQIVKSRIDEIMGEGYTW